MALHFRHLGIACPVTRSFSRTAMAHEPVAGCTQTAKALEQECNNIDNELTLLRLHMGDMRQRVAMLAAKRGCNSQDTDVEEHQLRASLLYYQSQLRGVAQRRRRYEHSLSIFILYFGPHADI